MPSSRAHVPPACWAQVWSVVRGRGKRIPSGGTLVLGREQDCEGAPAGPHAFSQQWPGRERDCAAAATDSITSSLIQAPCCTHHATSLQGAASIRTRVRPGQHGSALQDWGRLRAACIRGAPCSSAQLRPHGRRLVRPQARRGPSPAAPPARSTAARWVAPCRSAAQRCAGSGGGGSERLWSWGPSRSRSGHSHLSRLNPALIPGEPWAGLFRTDR